MFAISLSAAEAIRLIVSSSDIPEVGGIRISAEPVDEHEATLDLSLAEAPAIGDAVVEEEGAKVFLEQSAAPFLDDKILDANVEGERVSFSIVEQRQDWSQDGQPKSFDPRSIG